MSTAFKNTTWAAKAVRTVFAQEAAGNISSESRDHKLEFLMKQYFGEGNWRTLLKILLDVEAGRVNARVLEHRKYKMQQRTADTAKVDKTGDEAPF